jgi:beta-N-acetylhexosaminidase
MALATKGLNAPIIGQNGTENTIGDYVEETELKFPGEEAALAYKEERITFSEEVEEKLSSMTLEEKVAQLFIISPEALTGVKPVTVSGEATKKALNQYPVGGIMYNAENFTGEDQIKLLTGKIQNYSQERIGVPLFLAVGEEGGVDRSPVAKVNGYPITMSPGQLGSLADAELVTNAVNTRMEYLKDNGFNMVFGAIGNLGRGINASDDDRSYGRDWLVVKDMIEADILAVNNNNMTNVLRYFPSINSSGKYTEDAAHTLEIFQTGIDAGAKMIMVSNARAEYLTNDLYIPCSLSKQAVAVLRGTMGYEGILITASLSDDKITSTYGSGEAAVKAIEAGMDIIFEPADFEEAYEAVLKAVNDGTISQMRLENAVGRILELKMNE